MSGRFVDGGDIPDDEILTDSRGRVVDDAYVDRAVDDAARQSRRGRPSLSASGESPLLRVRVSPDLQAAVTEAARRSGRSRADWIRRALDEAARRAG